MKLIGISMLLKTNDDQREIEQTVDLEKLTSARARSIIEQVFSNAKEEALRFAEEKSPPSSREGGAA